MVVYKVTNLVNNKIYIGATTKTLLERKRGHLYSANNGYGYSFQKALRKYGKDNFRWQVICICPTADFLNEQEQYYIAFYDSINSGYNRTTRSINPGRPALSFIRKLFVRTETNNKEIQLSLDLVYKYIKISEASKLINLSVDRIYQLVKEYGIKTKYRRGIKICLESDILKLNEPVDNK